MTKLRLVSLSLALLLTVGCLATAAAEGVPELNPFGPFDIPDNAAMALLDQMGVGWNLGNTFDAFSDPFNQNELRLESYWNGCMTTPEMFDALKSAGFRSVRIPVSWHNHVDEEFRISEPWLNRVQEVVDYAYSRGFYVILNTHHDVYPQYYYPLDQYQETSVRYITTIWTQLSERFADYDEHLIFESMNEPRPKDTANEWVFDQNAAICREAAENINILNQAFVDTVRKAGGMNAERYLMVPGYCASPEGATSQYFRLPEDSADNRIIVSVHAYTPYEFALKEDGTATFSLDNMGQKSTISQFLNSLYKTYISQGIPVVIGEFGARNKSDNLQSRVDFAAFYTVAARSRNIPCLWWDNGAFKGNGELFGILDRRQAAFQYPDIVRAMITYQDCRITAQP